jgi:Putative oxalocrotonate tautomerase enzyme
MIVANDAALRSAYSFLSASIDLHSFQIFHCIPLSREQKDALAEFITNLHATTFVTPRLFVNVTFDRPGPIGDIYSGGKARGQTVPNHIRATVRVGPTRSKETYDEVATKIQSRWVEVVNDARLGAQSSGNLTTKEEILFKKLHGIVFCPMVTALKGGLIVPGVCRIYSFVQSF